MRFCYADPPYPGMAYLYKGHPDYDGEVDHAALIARIVAEFPDGWALSTASTTLQQVLPLCPRDVRILAWVKPYTPFKRGVKLAYAWEPIIICGGRKSDSDYTLFDWFSASVNIFGKGSKIAGQKPLAMCWWLFDCLGSIRGDELVDMFPGSGGVGRAWEQYQRQMTLPTLNETGKQARLEVS